MERPRTRRLKRSILWMFLAGAVVAAFLAGVVFGSLRGVPFVKKYQDWSIGVLVGETPFSLHPQAGVENPVLRASDLDDMNALFVADPFLLRCAEGYVVFFEALNRRDGKGDIAFATSPDGLRWTYGGIALDEPFHLSYPCVVDESGTAYMVPESVEAMGVFLYRAERFPEEWVRARVLIRGRYVDPTLTHRAGRWWLFVGEPENDVLRLFSAPSLADRFVEHPDSPLVLGTRASARPGGRVLSFDGRLFRCAQDGGRVYGERVRVFEIVRLDPERYEEVEVSGTLGPTGSGWNAAGMHHLDALEIEPGRWLAVADGWSRWRLSFGSP